MLRGQGYCRDAALAGTRRRWLVPSEWEARQRLWGGQRLCARQLLEAGAVAIAAIAALADFKVVDMTQPSVLPVPPDSCQLRRPRSKLAIWCGRRETHACLKWRCGDRCAPSTVGESVPASTALLQTATNLPTPRRPPAPRVRVTRARYPPHPRCPTSGCQSAGPPSRSPLPPCPLCRR